MILKGSEKRAGTILMFLTLPEGYGNYCLRHHCIPHGNEFFDLRYLMVPTIVTDFLRWRVSKTHIQYIIDIINLYSGENEWERACLHAGN